MACCNPVPAKRMPGRVVDVSYSAAQEPGMINRGVAKVKLDVVQ